MAGPCAHGPQSCHACLGERLALVICPSRLMAALGPRLGTRSDTGNAWAGTPLPRKKGKWRTSPGCQSRHLACCSHSLYHDLECHVPF